MKTPSTVFRIAPGTLVQNRQTGAITAILSEPKTWSRRGRQYTTVNCFSYKAGQYRSLQVSQVLKYYKPTGLHL
ncbi:hypothetical protein Lepto7375DRAFT_1754 [Leptolyngbya sp. PCC 7375]|nr:hypothetical protein Lepto7375DRAFT_1754 [Leptolyngbya sp. PCC 7375]